MTNKDLFLPENYVRRSAPEYFNDSTAQLYQPDVYYFAQKLAEGFGAQTLIDIGCGNGDRVVEISKNIKCIGMDFGNNLNSAKNKYPDKSWLNINFEESMLHLLDVPNKGFVICADVIEHLINPMHLIEYLRGILPNVYGIVISTPDRDRARGVSHLGPPTNLSHVAEWSKEELNLFLKNNGLVPMLHGFTRNISNNTTRSTQVVFIPGGLLKPAKEIKILAIVPCFNEVDIISHTIDNLIAQNIDVHVLDNWSTDGTWELLQKYTNITTERFPDVGSDEYNWSAILERMDVIGYSSSYDWIMHVDADEHIVSPANNISLKDFISIADTNGFEIIDLTHLAFRPVEENANQFSAYWQFSDFPADANIHRAWKNKRSKIGLAAHGGHILRGKKFPLNLILKHYPLRSAEQARKKIFRDRIPRARKERLNGWHVHYDSYKETHSYIWDKNTLNLWDKNTINEWLIEITTKINLPFSNLNLPKGFN